MEQRDRPLGVYAPDVYFRYSTQAGAHEVDIGSLCFRGESLQEQW